MNILGTSFTGGIIVEFTREERSELDMAQKVFDGETFVFDMGQGVDLKDIAPIFKALRLWMMAKLAINNLQMVVDKSNAAIGINNQIPTEQNKNSS